MDIGTFGFKGEGNRALELPTGVKGGFAVGPSPIGRCRLRYNDVSKTLQVSLDGGAYVDLGVGGTSPGGADTQVQYNSAGVFAGSPDFTFDGTNVTLVNALFADGGVDVSAAGNLALGGANTTTMEVGSSVTSVIQIGDTTVAVVRVDVADNTPSAFRVREGVNNYIVVDTTNLGEMLTFGNVTTNPDVSFIGTGTFDVASSVITLGGVGTTAVNVGDSTASSVNVNVADNTVDAFQVQQGAQNYIAVDTTNLSEKVDFGNATTNPSYEFLGSGTVTINGKLTVVGAIDPPSVLLSGGTALFYESNDGSTAPVSGAATGRLRYNNGTAQWEASVQGGAYAALGGSSADINIADDTVDAFLVHEATRNYIAVDTSNSGANMTFGNAFTSPTYNFLGSGLCDFAGPIEAGGVTTTTLNTTSSLIVGGGVIDLDPTSGYTLDMNTSHAIVITMSDNLDNAWRLKVGTDDYLIFDTRNGVEEIVLGNAVTNPDVTILGTGAISLGVGGSTIGHFGATPVVQQATTGTVAGFTAGIGIPVNNVSTFTGGTGASAYTIGDIVLALKNYGLLAA